MAKRIFRLPSWDELTDQQLDAIELPEEGQYLIIGAPGTGKSVVALWRLQKLSNSENVLFLTFNHVLAHANKNLASDCYQNIYSSMSWFYDIQWKVVGGTKETYDVCQMPERDSYKPDYDEVIKRFEFNKDNHDYKKYSLIIDEGQDLPPQWYDAVETLGIDNYYIVADQNQKITEECSNRKELEEALGLESSEVIELTENWRNSTPIALLSGHFYTDQASPKPALPDRPSADTPILYEYDHIDKVKEQILAQYDVDDSKLIGLIVANDNKREHWKKCLGKDDKPRRNPGPVVSSYHHESKGNVDIDFSNGGIVVLCDKSVKGIEFDTVFIITDGLKAADSDSLKKKMYVMTSRARERLYLFKSHVQPNPMLEDILPKEGERATLKDGSQVRILKRVKL